jgi:hypothetical protein
MNEIRDGVRYVLAFLASAAGWAQLGPVLLAPLAILGAAWSTPRARAHYALLSLTAIGLLAVAIYAGGDGYPNGRLLAPAIAFGVLAMAFAMVQAQGRLRTACLAAVCAVIVAHGVTMVSAGPPEWGSHVNSTAPEFRACEGGVAHALQRVVPDGTVAQTDFQRLKYWSEPLRVRDLEGLNDREIAHQRVEGPVRLGKFRPATVLRSRPEVWIPGHQFRTLRSRVATPSPLLADAATQMRVLGFDEPAKAAEGEVATALAALYVPASLEACGLTYNLFVRKDLAAQFAAAGFSVEGF